MFLEPIALSALQLVASSKCMLLSLIAHMPNLECVCRHKGVLQVWVLEAKDLQKQDIGGKADPFVQLQTRVQDLEKTVRLNVSCIFWCTRASSQTKV